MPNAPENAKNKVPLSISVTLMGIGVLGLLLGVVQVTQGIRGSVQQTVQRDTATEQLADSAADVEALRELDTDQDGLSDYEELYLYETSPYILDSDSDGTSDADEIAAGDDPNCPKGATCGPVAGNTIATGEGATTPEGISAAQLRQALLNAGAPEHLVNNISDEDLIATYQETVAEGVDSGLFTGLSNATTEGSDGSESVLSGGSISLEDLRGLSAADIRSLLVSTGLDEASLTEVDDETLQTIFLEALDEQAS